MRKVGEFIIPGQDNTDYVLICKPLCVDIVILKLTLLQKTGDSVVNNPTLSRKMGSENVSPKIYSSYDNQRR